MELLTKMIRDDNKNIEIKPKEAQLFLFKNDIIYVH